MLVLMMTVLHSVVSVILSLYFSDEIESIVLF
jgi:hypothetical protein